MKAKFVAKLTIAAALSTMPLLASAVLIDEFNSGAYSITANSATPIAEAVRPGTMLGAERDALLGWLGGPLSVNAVANISGGGVQFLNASTETSGFLILQYDGNAEAESELDFTQTLGNSLAGNFSADNRFVFDFAFIDAGLSAQVSITTTVVSSSGTTSFTSFVANGLNIQHNVFFSSFGAVNWANVNSVTFRFDAPAAADFTLDRISTTNIPGPAAFVPFVVGLIALRRRKK